MNQEELNKIDLLLESKCINNWILALELLKGLLGNKAVRFFISRVTFENGGVYYSRLIRVLELDCNHDCEKYNFIFSDNRLFNTSKIRREWMVEFANERY